MKLINKTAKQSTRRFWGSRLLKQFSVIYFTLIALFFIWVKVLNPYLSDLFIHKFFASEIYEDKIHDYETAIILLKHIYPTLTPEQWKALIIENNKKSNLPIKIIPIKYLRLPQKSMDLLAKNKPTMPFYPNDIHYEMITPELVAKIGPRVDGFITRNYITVSILLRHIYPTKTQQQWQDLIDENNETSNVPIKIIPLTSLKLPKKSMILLAQNKPTVPSNVDDTHFEMITPNLVAKIGPMGVKEDADFAYGMIEYSPLIVLGAFTLLWVLAIQYRLIILENSVTSYSHGNFKSRATTGFWKLGNLNFTFNQMAERLNRLFHSQKQLTNAVSHELRSPISRLRFQLEMLQNASDHKTRQGYAVGMSDDLDDMDNLIHELLNYTNLESKEPLKQWEEVDLSQWIKSQQQHLYAEISHEITLSALPENTLVSIDTQSMGRLLRNLVDNADKYTKDCIIIGAHVSDTACMFWVDDNGCGIPPEKVDQLFEPFSRLDSSRNKTTGGYGLGLAIVAQIIRRHQGHIQVRNNKYGGARFTVSWPRKLSQQLEE